MAGVITLTTDFGTIDPYAGIMKGVISGIAPDAGVIDITHDIPPQDVFKAAFTIKIAYPYFPDGSIHVVVVDPGVGSTRRRIAIKCKKCYFVGPDNGVFTYPLMQEPDWECIEIEANPISTYHGRTFDGRDVFAPAAARIASGVPFSELGLRITDPVTLSIPPVSKNKSENSGRIVYIDHYGNCVSNIQMNHISDVLTEASVTAESHNLGPIRLSYSEVSPGQPLALINSFDHLEIAVNQGNAAEMLGLSLGAEVRVVYRA